MGLKKRILRQDEKEFILKYWNVLTKDEIKRALQMSTSTLYTHAKALKIPLSKACSDGRKSKASEEKWKEKLNRLITDGEPILILKGTISNAERTWIKRRVNKNPELYWVSLSGHTIIFSDDSRIKAWDLLIENKLIVGKNGRILYDRYGWAILGKYMTNHATGGRCVDRMKIVDVMGEDDVES